MESSGMKDYHCGSTSRGVDTVQVLINKSFINDCADADLCRRTSTLARAGINTGATGEPLLTGNSPNS